MVLELKTDVENISPSDTSEISPVASVDKLDLLAGLEGLIVLIYQSSLVFHAPSVDMLCKTNVPVIIFGTQRWAERIEAVHWEVLA